MEFRKRIFDPKMFRDRCFIGRPFLRDAYHALCHGSDDQGVVEADIDAFTEDCFGGDPGYDFADQCRQLVEIGKLLEYQRSGRTYWLIKNFFKHQRLGRITRALADVNSSEIEVFGNWRTDNSIVRKVSHADDFSHGRSEYHCVCYAISVTP